MVEGFSADDTAKRLIAEYQAAQKLAQLNADIALHKAGKQKGAKVDHVVTAKEAAAEVKTAVEQGNFTALTLSVKKGIQAADSAIAANPPAKIVNLNKKA